MHLALGEDLEIGLAAADEAVTFSRQYPNEYAEIQSLNCKIRFHLALNQSKLARETAEELMPLMEIIYSNWGRQELLWTLYLEKKEAGDVRGAAEELQRAFDYVELIASRITDDDIRQSWLEKVPDNPKIITEAKELGLPHPRNTR